MKSLPDRGVALSPWTLLPIVAGPLLHPWGESVGSPRNFFTASGVAFGFLAKTEAFEFPASRIRFARYSSSPERASTTTVYAAGRPSALTSTRQARTVPEVVGNRTSRTGIGAENGPGAKTVDRSGPLEGRVTLGKATDGPFICTDESSDGDAGCWVATAFASSSGSEARSAAISACSGESADVSPGSLVPG